MNTDTLYFRSGLTIAAIWVTAFAYLSYSGYQEAYQSTEYALLDLPEGSTYECYFPVINLIQDDFQSRRPTNKEISSCLKRIEYLHKQSIVTGNRSAFKKAWESFVYKGVLPPLALLVALAFWTAIVEILTRTGSSYLKWLRFGAAKHLGQSSNDET